MDDIDVIRFAGDITTELQAIGQTISTAVENDLHKKYYDDTIGSVVKEAIIEVLAKVSSSEAGKNYYYNELVEVIKNSMSEIIEKVAKTKPDMSPLIRIAADISNQNKEVINALVQMKDTGNDDSKYQNVMSMLLRMIESNNEFIKASMNQKEYLNKIEELISAVNKRPDSWTFEHNLDYGKLKSTTAIPKYKS